MGACRSPDVNFRDNMLGIGKVQCQDKSLGPYMSPTMFKLREEEDMFRWWKATANPNFMGFDENNEPIYKEAMPREGDDDEREAIVSPAGAGLDAEDYYEDDDEYEENGDEYEEYGDEYEEYGDEDEHELGFDHQDYIEYHEY